MSNYLIHYGTKGQKWGIRRYQNEDGTLTAEGRKRYGIEGINSKEIISNQNSWKARRQLKKESKKLWANYVMSDIARGKIKETYQEADKRFQDDIKRATKDKNFVSDWKKATKNVASSLFSEKDDWIDREDNEIKKLKKKYPKYKEIIEGFAPHEKFSSKNDVNKYLKSNKNPVYDMINNDHYYEPKTYNLDKKTSTILNTQACKEITDYLNNKYGKTNVDTLYAKYNKTSAIGTSIKKYNKK